MQAQTQTKTTTTPTAVAQKAELLEKQRKSLLRSITKHGAIQFHHDGRLTHLSQSATEAVRLNLSDPDSVAMPPEWPTGLAVMAIYEIGTCRRVPVEIWFDEEWKKPVVVILGQAYADKINTSSSERINQQCDRLSSIEDAIAALGRGFLPDSSGGTGFVASLEAAHAIKTAENDARWNEIGKMLDGDRRKQFAAQMQDVQQKAKDLLQAAAKLEADFSAIQGQEFNSVVKEMATQATAQPLLAPISGQSDRKVAEGTAE